jgi:hypothetical protein
LGSRVPDNSGDSAENYRTTQAILTRKYRTTQAKKPKNVVFIAIDRPPLMMIIKYLLKSFLKEKDHHQRSHPLTDPTR